MAHGHALGISFRNRRKGKSFDPTYIIEIDTEQSGVSNNDQFQFTGAIGEYDVDAVQGGTVVATFTGLVNEETITLPAPGVYELHIKLGNGKFFDKFQVGRGGDRRKLLRTLQWGLYGVNEDDQSNAFFGCGNHSEIAGEGKWFEVVTNGSRMLQQNNLSLLPESMTLPFLENGGEMFRENSLTSLPEGMTLPLLSFGRNIFRDNSLTSLPEGMYLPSLSIGDRMFEGNTLSTESLSRLYCGMSEKNPSNNVDFHGGEGNYDPSLNFVIDGVTVNTGDARQDLVNRGWSITDGGALIVIQPFDEGDWSMNNDEGTIELIIDELPTVNVGGAITDIEYRVNGGNPISLGENTTGTYIITGVQEEDDIQIRAINDVSGSPWSDVKEVPSEFNPIQATGGDEVFDITQNGITYRVHVFEGSDDFVVTDIGDQGKVEYLAVAGGGGGGSRRGGGGGAGGYRTSVGQSGGGASAETNLSVTVGAHEVVVGAGGAGSTNSAASGDNGNNSSFLSVVSLGGGGGGSGDIDNPTNGNSGGSGGGGAGEDATLGGNGETNQGFGGGVGGTGILTTSSGAGGGGASSIGENAAQPDPSPGTSRGGDGGAGIISEITGTSVARAGGGGGGGNTSDRDRNGFGVDGGGDGGDFLEDGLPATANTGGGGGGGANVQGSDFKFGGNGGSGITIIRYPLNQPI